MSGKKIIEGLNDVLAGRVQRVMAGHYAWHPPKAKHGDTVFAQGHKGAPREGRITSIETRYSRDGTAYHNYGVRFHLNKVTQWLGDDAILSVTPTDE